MVLFPAFYQKAGSKDRAGWLVLLKAYLNAHSVTYGDRSNRNKPYSTHFYGVYLLMFCISHPIM